MGMLIDGKWTNDDERQRFSQSGAFQRNESIYRDWVTADGSSGYKAEPGRYHLLVAWSCPWAHRTAIFRKLKKLEGVISIAYSDGPRDQGWAFPDLGIGGFQPIDGFFACIRSTPSTIRRRAPASPCRHCGTRRRAR